ncbi:unnamed protein product [Caenorhabditis angaria]|uniref:TP53RK-binding protein n=1 Tax=Caenorhabditis angaria TaxID=860376 RepID=A0A9P1INM6_9PELO|nr:unnamed protein product [Caenorhabditis angaria]
MKNSQLYELQPDPYDVTQRKFVRFCLFNDVKNAAELCQLLREQKIDAALIRSELVLEPFVLLAAANRAVHQSAHNRMSCRSLSAELIYSLSPSRNISDSLVTFGISENSTSIIAATFDDKSGSLMKKLAKKIKAKSVPFENLGKSSNVSLIKKVYQVGNPSFAPESLPDHIISRIVSKDFVS